MHEMNCTDVAELLVAYVNGTANDEDRERVRRHAAACKACRDDIEEWQACRVASIATFAALPAPVPETWRAIEARIDRDAARMTAPAGMGHHLSHAWLILVAQLPLVRRGIWAASALTTALGILVALETRTSGGGGMVLALFAPVMAAVGVAFIYTPETDPSLELALTTPTSPRSVLLSRLTLVFGYDLLLALIPTLLLATLRGDGVWGLIALWIGPMLVLSALSLVLSLMMGSTAAIALALTVWALHLLQVAGDRLHWLAGVPLAGLWQTSVPVVLLAVALFAIAVLYLPSREPRLLAHS